MSYPRIITINNKDVLVNENQCVGYKEHLSHKHRMLFFNGVIGMRCTTCGGGETELQSQLMALDTLSHDPIKLVITSPGGDLDTTFLFYDTIKLIQSPIITVGRYCASAAALILAAGETRFLFPHAKVMLHKPWGRREGDSRDFEIQGAEMKKYESGFIKALIDCGATKNYAEILNDIDRDLWLEPTEAIAYGLADKIITKEVWQSWIKEV